MSSAKLEELFTEQLKDLYSAENQLLKALPKMAKKASTPLLAEAFESHWQETEKQVERLDQIGKALGVKLTGKKCAAMVGLIEEGKEAMEEEEKGPMLDAMMIAAAQRVEHYEISAYGTARCLAELLGDETSVGLLQATQDEEAAADTKLNGIARDEVYPSFAAEEPVDEPARNGKNISTPKHRAKRRQPVAR